LKAFNCLYRKNTFTKAISIISFSQPWLKTYYVPLMKKIIFFPESNLLLSQAIHKPNNLLLSELKNQLQLYKCVTQQKHHSSTSAKYIKNHKL